MLYKLTDVANALSVSRTKVYELVRSGALPSVRIGGSRRVRGEDLAGYVDSLERVSASSRRARDEQGSQGNAAPKLRNGVMRRGNTWSYVIRVTDSRGVSKPRWVGGFPTEAAAKRARDEARIAAGRGDFVDRSTLTVQDYLNQWLAGARVGGQTANPGRVRAPDQALTSHRGSGGSGCSRCARRT